MAELRVVKGKRATRHKKPENPTTIRIIIIPSMEDGYGCMVLTSIGYPVDVMCPIEITVPVDAISYRKVGV